MPTDVLSETDLSGAASPVRVLRSVVVTGKGACVVSCGQLSTTRDSTAGPRWGVVGLYGSNANDVGWLDW